MSISRIMLAKFGAIVPAENVLACVVLPSLVRKQKILREISLAGLQYEEGSEISLSLRIYLGGIAPEILTSFGVDVLEDRNVLNSAAIDAANAINAQRIADAETEEEEAPRRGPKRARRVTAKPEVELVEVPEEISTSRKYVEYVLTEIALGDSNIYSITDHPAFIEASDVPGDNAAKLMGRLNRYVEACRTLQSNLTNEAEGDDDGDEDGFGQPKLTASGMTAQAQAFAANQEAARAYLEKQWAFFQSRFIGDGDVVEPISVDEASANYGHLSDDGGPLLSTMRYIEYIAADVIDIGFGADKE